MMMCTPCFARGTDLVLLFDVNLESLVVLTIHNTVKDNGCFAFAKIKMKSKFKNV